MAREVKVKPMCLVCGNKGKFYQNSRNNNINILFTEKNQWS